MTRSQYTSAHDPSIDASSLFLVSFFLFQLRLLKTVSQCMFQVLFVGCSLHELEGILSFALSVEILVSHFIVIETLLVLD